MIVIRFNSSRVLAHVSGECCCDEMQHHCCGSEVVFEYGRLGLPPGVIWINQSHDLVILNQISD